MHFQDGLYSIEVKCYFIAVYTLLTNANHLFAMARGRSH
jgi:hypothetical protein